MLGPILQLPTVPLQSLSELERFCLQELSLCKLREQGLCSDITPDHHKPKKSVRRTLEQRDAPTRVFGVPLSDVIAQDRAVRQSVFAVRSRRAGTEVESTVLSFLLQTERISMGGTSLQMPLSSTFRSTTVQHRRRGALSVDSITELDDGDDRLLEALQLSHPAELQSQHDPCLRLSLNPIYKQVPRIIESCCSHIETHGLNTVGIFRIGSSKKRVEQLREEFSISGDVLLGEDICVHDVSTLLKLFLRELPDPILPTKLYTAFIQTAGSDIEEALRTLQLLIYSLPPCNADTLFRILRLLHKVSLHEHDTVGTEGEQVPGNKMSIMNLATVFGPNLLNNDRGLESGKESFLNSAAQIRVTETLIQHYKELFMVPSHVHSSILMRLLQTDPEVVDYLMRRKSSFAEVVSSQQLTLDLGCSILSQDSVKSFMQLTRREERTGFLASSSHLYKRRSSRSQEDLTTCHLMSSEERQTQCYDIW
ncbi:rho GTPase-activating protein 6-like [Pelodytes ibericus]